MIHYKMSRREFIEKSAQCAAFAAAGAALPGLFCESARAGRRFPDIVVSEGMPGPATRGAVRAIGGMERFVKRGVRVVIKPNISFPNPPDMGSTTHPEVIRELAALCREAGAASVLILDNPLRDSELCLERSGLKTACGNLPETGVRVLDNERFFEKVDVPEGKDLTSTRIMKQVLAADVLIAAPVAKSHSATGVSLAMKGMMGLIHNRWEFHVNMDLNTAIVDLCTVLRPHLTVIDASRILSTGGPGGPGKVIPLNKIIASTDMVAADAMAVELGTWYGKTFRARQVKHIRLAHERGLGHMDIENQVIQEVFV